MRRPLLLALLLLPVVPVPASADGPCAPGQTALGGTLAGQGDGEPLNAMVGVELTDAATARAYDVFADGRVDTVGPPAGRRCSVVDDVNRQRTAAKRRRAPRPVVGRAGRPGRPVLHDQPAAAQHALAGRPAVRSGAGTRADVSFG